MYIILDYQSPEEESGHVKVEKDLEKAMATKEQGTAAFQKKEWEKVGLPINSGWQQLHRCSKPMSI